MAAPHIRMDIGTQMLDGNAPLAGGNGGDAGTMHVADRLVFLRPYWLIILSFVIFMLPGLVLLARNYWSTEQGAHGPIILCTGLWLLWRESDRLRITTENRWQPILSILAIIGGGLFMVLMSILGKQWVQWATIYGVFLAIMYLYFGFRQLWAIWFPLAYLAFLIPPSPAIIYPLTHWLKVAIANSAVDVLQWFGYPVANTGATLLIGQYELVVAAACAGMNSLVSLMAIGLFYIYLLHRASLRYALVLAAFIIPIAVFANFVRVIVLLLVTYHLGDAAGQGMLHDAAGMTTFFIALGSLMLLDTVLAPRFNRRKN